MRRSALPEPREGERERLFDSLRRGPATEEQSTCARTQWAVQLIQTCAGRVHGVEYVDLQSRTRRTVHAGLVILAANAVQIGPRCCCAPANRWHSRGIGNDADLVGRGFFLQSERLCDRDVGGLALGSVDRRTVPGPPHARSALLDHLRRSRLSHRARGVIYDAHYAEPERNAGRLRLQRPGRGASTPRQPRGRSPGAQRPWPQQTGVSSTAPTAADLDRLDYLTHRANRHSSGGRR